MGLLKLRRQKAIELAKSWEGPAPHARPVPRRPMGIEDLLRWAYREELPKTPRTVAGPAPIGGGWEAMSKWAEELPLAGLDENKYGLVADPFAEVWPHSDAVTVHNAMNALDAAEPDNLDGWWPFDDLPPLGAHTPRLLAAARDSLFVTDDQGKAVLRRPLRHLIVKHAILGGAPDWVIDPPTERRVLEHGMVKWFVMTTVKVDGAFGPVAYEVEQDGFDHRRRIPKPDAYNKYYLDPDPFDGVVGRGEYSLWLAALDLLAFELAPALRTIEVIPCQRPAEPWLTGDVCDSRILPDLSPTPPVDEKPLRRRKKTNRAA